MCFIGFCNIRSWKLNVQLAELKWTYQLTFCDCCHMHANRTHTHFHTNNTHTRTLNQFSSPLSIHISIVEPPDVNKRGNPILYIFQRCQSVRMKCCLLALGKFIPSFLAKCSSSFICLSMYKCVRMKSLVTRQI